jgi:lantibiotic modifying enzyme
LELERRRDHREDEARQLLGGTIARQERTGTYRGVAGTNRVTKPTFFHGISGIGYTMLRATAVESLPCILLWE